MISETAFIGEGTEIGSGVIIEDGAKVGEHCQIGHYVIIRSGAVVGGHVRIDDHAVIGKQPMKALTSATSSGEIQPPCRIGSGTIIGTGAVIYANAIIGENCLIADLATVRENVTIGDRTIVGRGVAIENFCSIGSRCKLETNAYITAYSTIGNDCFIAPGVVTSNDNFAGRDPERFNHFKGITVEDGGRLGAQATVLPGVVIASECLVAACAVVTRSTGSQEIVAGNPAKKLRNVPEAQLLKNQPVKR